MISVKEIGNFIIYGNFTMQKIKYKPKIGIFIDDSNMFYAQRDAGWRVNYRKLKQTLSSVFLIKFIHCHTAVPSKNDPKRKDALSYLKQVRKQRVSIIQKALKYIRQKDGKIVKKGDVDLEIAIDTVENLKEVDIVLILSGDSDYVVLKNYILRQGKKVVFVSFKNYIAWELTKGKYLLLDNYRELLDSNAKTNPKISLGAILLTLLYHKK